MATLFPAAQQKRASQTYLSHQIRQLFLVKSKTQAPIQSVSIMEPSRVSRLVEPSEFPQGSRQSGNHAALEHFVGDGTGDAVEKFRTHLRVLAQHLDRFLL